MAGLCGKFEEDGHVNQYQVFRPVYTSNIYEKIMDYLYLQMERGADSRLPLAVDVGCGTGHQSTYGLKDYFTSVVGVDISQAMIQAANQENTIPNIKFVCGSAGSLPIEDNSAYLVTAATALHWFDYDEFYPELDRILTPGGVFAAFCFNIDMEVTGHPRCQELTEILHGVFNVLRERDHFGERNERIFRRYTDKDMQIPYEDRVRVDRMDMSFSTSPESVVSMFDTFSAMREMLVAEPEFAHDWWTQQKKRFIDICTETGSVPNSPIDIQMFAFVIMGRKPRKN